MALTLRYKANASVPVEAQCLVPDRLREKSVAEIERLEVYHGNRKVPLAEFFQVSGDPTDARLELEGDLSGVHWIGTKMADGVIHFQGNAGRHVGGEMTGGTILVEGDTSDWIGAEMRGGQIQIRGRAGHLVGAAYRGSRRGMMGGTILVHGDVGNEVGIAMRRGTIAVGGSCGDAAGFSMIAGTIAVFGPCGIRPGAGMKRGTIGLFGPDPPRLLPTFRLACRYRPPFLAVLVRELARSGFPVDDGLARGDVLLYRGDLVALGKGEVWMRAS